MADIDWESARHCAREIADHPRGGGHVQNICRAYLITLEALEYEVSGREHDLTAKILGPRMPDRKAYETDGGDW